MWWPMHARKIAALPFCSDTLSLCLHLRRKAAWTFASLCASPSQYLLAKICARQSFLVHLCHDVEHAELEAQLPPEVRVSYDGLRVRLT